MHVPLAAQILKNIVDFFFGNIQITTFIFASVNSVRFLATGDMQLISKFSRALEDC